MFHIHEFGITRQIYDEHLQIEGNKELKKKRKQIEEPILLISCSVYSLRIIGWLIHHLFVITQRKRS